MIGAICGDIIGSPYESWLFEVHDKSFPLFSSACRFTDDSVLTVAIADAILCEKPYEKKLKEWYDKHPNCGYGSNFVEWCKYSKIHDESSPTYELNRASFKVKSNANGAMMRVSPISYAFNDLDTIFKEVEKSVQYTHDTDEARKGAKAIASAVFMARNGKTKDEIKNFIESTFGYNLNYTVQQVRETFSKTTICCDVTGPQSLIAFLEGTDYEDTIRSAIYSKGDCDTIAAIAGSIAYPFYKEIPENIKQFMVNKLPQDMIDVVIKFNQKYPN